MKITYPLVIVLISTSVHSHYPSFSLPSEVCTVISDADCITPMETVCSAALPSPDCQMILRQFFNDTGVFCINVSLTNDVSLAVTSARVSVSVGEWKRNYTMTLKSLKYSVFRIFSHLCDLLQFQPPVVPQVELQPQSSGLWFSLVSSVVLVWCTGELLNYQFLI